MHDLGNCCVFDVVVVVVVVVVFHGRLVLCFFLAGCLLACPSTCLPTPHASIKVQVAGSGNAPTINGYLLQKIWRAVILA